MNRYNKYPKLGNPLSPSERDTLDNLAQSCSYKEVAENLGIAVSTAKFHVKNCMVKLGVSNKTHAAVVYVMNEHLRGRKWDWDGLKLSDPTEDE